MPKPTLDQQKEQVEKLKKSLAEKGEGMEAAPLRDLKKKVRRAQRKHHLTTVEAGRRAVKPAEKVEVKAEAKPEVKVEVQAEVEAEVKPEAPAEEPKEEAADQPES
jgi:hypothetical protein